MGLTAFPAQALDMKGYSTANDAACWLDPICSKPRGGSSDVMTVYGPDESICQQIFAFGNEEANNSYNFDPNLVPVDPNQFGNYTTLLEPDVATRSEIDTFGVYSPSGMLPPSSALALAFISDPYQPRPQPHALTFVETPGAPNPVPEGTDSAYLTVPNNATQYLSSAMQEQRYTATFRSDVPEPTSVVLVGIGLAGLGWTWRKRTYAKR